MRPSVPARVAAFTAVLALAGLVAAAPAAAHDELTGSSPAAGATLTRLPERVQLYFEEAPEPDPIRMRVVGPDGIAVNSTGPQLSGSTLTENLTSSTRAGAYVISYRILSDDGHPVAGTIRFTLAPGAAPAAAAAPARPASPRGSNTWIALVAAVVVVGAGAAAAVS